MRQDHAPEDHSANDRLVVREGTYSLSAIRLGVREGTMEQTLSEPCTATF